MSFVPNCAANTTVLKFIQTIFGITDYSLLKKNKSTEKNHATAVIQWKGQENQQLCKPL